jgi:putative transposase
VNPRWHRPYRDVRGQGEHATSVGEVAQTLLGMAPSASAISRLDQDLEQKFQAWLERPLQAHWRLLYLDGIHLVVRHGDRVDAIMILTALGVGLAGNKEVLALRACAGEDKDGWLCVLQDLRTRGATPMDLIVTDGHVGLLAAFKAKYGQLYPEAVRSLAEEDDKTMTFYR